MSRDHVMSLVAALSLAVITVVASLPLEALGQSCTQKCRGVTCYKSTILVDACYEWEASQAMTPFTTAGSTIATPVATGYTNRIRLRGACTEECSPWPPAAGAFNASGDPACSGTAGDWMEEPHKSCQVVT